MASSSTAQPVNPSLDVIFSCSICALTITEIYRNADSNQGFHDGFGAESGIVTKLWLTQCGHVTCGKHLDGGGAPIHPENERPRARCPLCLRNKNDEGLKDLYGIRGIDDYDKGVPGLFYKVPPKPFDLQSEGGAALWFQYEQLLRFGELAIDKLGTQHDGSRAPAKSLAVEIDTQKQLEKQLDLQKKRCEAQTKEIKANRKGMEAQAKSMERLELLVDMLENRRKELEVSKPTGNLREKRLETAAKQELLQTRTCENEVKRLEDENRRLKQQLESIHRESRSGNTAITISDDGGEIAETTEVDNLVENEDGTAISYYKAAPEPSSQHRSNLIAGAARPVSSRIAHNSTGTFRASYGNLGVKRGREQDNVLVDGNGVEYRRRKYARGESRVVMPPPPPYFRFEPRDAGLVRGSRTGYPRI